MRKSVALIGMFAGLSWGASASTIFSFSVITSNGVNGAAMASQLSVDVSDAGGGLMSFLFKNIGSIGGSIANVYFDDDAGVLTGISSVINGAGVGFSVGGSPTDLPSGGTVGFSSDYTASADPPPSSNGVEPGEELTLLMSIAGGSGASDVLTAMSAGTLRLGMHVISIEQPGGGDVSESFVNDPPGTIIPLPTGAGLAATGLALLGVRRRR